MDTSQPNDGRNLVNGTKKMRKKGILRKKVDPRNKVVAVIKWEMAYNTD